MAIYEVLADALLPLVPTSLEAEGLLERRDLQRLLRDSVSVIAPDTMVLSEEFGDWSDSKRRIDLLAVDKRGDLVVIELKRSDDAAMELQALRYAAMVSAMSFDKAVEVHDAYRANRGQSGDASEELLSFLGWDEPKEDQFAREVRIVLAAAEFSKELTTAVIWLNQRRLDIRCVRMKPYKSEGRVLLDVQQVMPLPEAAEYQVQLRAKEESQKDDASRYSERRAFWTALLARARTKTPSFAGISPGPENWISATAGRSGLSWTYAARQHDTQVEFYIDFGDAELNKAAFDRLLGERVNIEAAYGEPLEWQRLDAKRGCRIRQVFTEGGYREPEEAWPQIHATMIGAMERLQSALIPLMASL